MWPMRIRYKLAAAGVAAAAAATVALAAPAAHADEILMQGPPALVNGFVSVHSDLSQWSIRFINQDPLGRCVRLKINIVRHLRRDRQFGSEFSCTFGRGPDKDFQNPPDLGRLAGTQGLRVYRCYLDQPSLEEVCPDNVWVPET